MTNLENWRSWRISLFTHREWLRTIVIFVFLAINTCALTWRIFQNGISFDSPDLWIHVNWMQQFSKHLSEGILYPRWLVGTNYGYGSPTFVFYPPLVFYLGSALKALSLNVERAIAILFWFALFLSGLTSYCYFKTKVNRLPALLGATFYLSAPYGIYNIYSRGALPETFAFWIPPLIFWFTDKALVHQKWRLLLSLGFTLLAITHVPSLLITTIIWGMYLLLLLFLERVRYRDVLILVFFASLGLGIASLYLLPALLERAFANISSMRGVSGGYANNLIPLNPRISNNTVGHIRAFYNYLLASTVLFSVSAIYSYKANNKRLNQIYVLLFLLLLCCFCMSALSRPVWERIPLIQMIQFPWRMLGISSFILSGIVAFSVRGIQAIRKKKRVISWFLGTLILLTIFWNMKYSYILSMRYPGVLNPGDLSIPRAEKRWTAKSFDLVTTAINDPYSNRLKDVQEYWPIVPQTQRVALAAESQRPPIEVISGNATPGVVKWNRYTCHVNVSVRSRAVVRLRVYYYPAWQLSVDGIAVAPEIDREGTFLVSLEPGERAIQLKYGWTQSFAMGLALSFLCLAIYASFGLRYLRINS